MKHRMILIHRPAAALLILAAAVLVMPAQAADNAKLAELKTSLNSVPEDASLYLGMFRAGQRIEAIGQSNAWTKLVESPVVKIGLKMWEMKSENTDTVAGKAVAMLQDTQVQDALALLADMFDDEAFLYADGSLVDSLSLMQKFQRFQATQGFREGAQNELQEKLATLAEANEEERDAIFEQIDKMQKARVKHALDFAAENLDAIKVPTLVFGSKLDDTTRAEINIAKLEFIVGLAMMQAGRMQEDLDFSEVLKREKIGESNFLVLSASGEMFPWDEENFLVEMAEEDENAAKLVEKLKKEKLVIAVGVKGDYLLISIGSSLDEIKKFGEGPALVSRPEMAKLEPFAGEPITDISYVSEKLMALNAAYQKDLEVAYDLAKEKLADVAELTQKEKGRILSDIEALGKDLKSVFPKPGALSSVSFMTSTGEEQYTFSWALGGPGQQPLVLLNHVGGSPILAIVSALPMDVETYDVMARWVDVGWGYFEKYGLPNMPDEKQAEAKEAITLFGPLVEAFHKTTREQFLPAFGGEIALQADTELQLSGLPGIEQTMPMLEPAIILAVKDQDLMDQALQSYWEILGDAIAAAATKNEDLADFQLPEPSTIEGDAGKMYVFDLPPVCPVSGQVQPTVGIGKDTLVFAATPKAAQSLMKAMPLSYKGVLADAKKPRISAGCFAWKDLLAAGTPWVMLGVEQAIADCADDCPLPPEAIRDQAKTVLEVLSVFRKITVETYHDKDVTVTHTEAEIKDVEKP